MATECQTEPPHALSFCHGGCKYSSDTHAKMYRKPFTSLGFWLKLHLKHHMQMLQEPEPQLHGLGRDSGYQRRVTTSQRSEKRSTLKLFLSYFQTFLQQPGQGIKAASGPQRFGPSDPLLWPALPGRPSGDPPFRSLSSGLLDYRDRSNTIYTFEAILLWQVTKFRGLTVTKIQTAVGSLDRQFANRIPCCGLDPRRIHH